MRHLDGNDTDWTGLDAVAGGEIHVIQAADAPPASVRMHGCCVGEEESGLSKCVWCLQGGLWECVCVCV